MFMYLKNAGLVANSVDPDQTPQVAASDQGMHCLLLITFTVCSSLSITKLRVNTV